MFCGMDIRYTALGRGKELRVYLPCARGYSYHSGAGAARMHYPYGCRRHGLDSSGVGNFRNAQFQRAEKGRALAPLAIASGRGLLIDGYDLVFMRGMRSGVSHFFCGLLSEYAGNWRCDIGHGHAFSLIKAGIRLTSCKYHNWIRVLRNAQKSHITTAQRFCTKFAHCRDGKRQP